MARPFEQSEFPWMNLLPSQNAALPIWSRWISKGGEVLALPGMQRLMLHDQAADLFGIARTGSGAGGLGDIEPGGLPGLPHASRVTRAWPAWSSSIGRNISWPGRWVGMGDERELLIRANWGCSSACCRSTGRHLLMPWRRPARAGWACLPGSRRRKKISPRSTGWRPRFIPRRATAIFSRPIRPSIFAGSQGWPLAGRLAAAMR